MAISASLLPPAVNAGLLSSYSLLAALIPSIGEHSSSDDYPERSDLRSSSAKNCTKFLDNDYLPIYSCHMARETALLSLCSFLLTMTNILCIIGNPTKQTGIFEYSHMSSRSSGGDDHLASETSDAHHA